jgi:phosphoglycerate dehydrogenase-like enzyme
MSVMREIPRSPRIAILDDYQGEAADLADWSVLPPGTRIEVFRHAARSDDEQADRLAPFDIVVAMRERSAFSAPLLERLPRLALLASTGLRNAAIDVAACKRLGIATCGSRGHPTGLAATAETAWALVLALTKRLVVSDQALRRGRSQPQLANALMGKTLGLVGLGRIGQQMARIGLAFGMEVIAWSPNLTPERAAAVGARAVGKAALFAEADVISLHLVLAESTAGIVSGPELSGMKRGSLLVNTARAGLIDEAALITALHERRIGGAGLDVFWREPLPADDPLLELDNVVLTPHLGYATRDNLAAFYTGVVDDIATWLAGGDVEPLAA